MADKSKLPQPDPAKITIHADETVYQGYAKLRRLTLTHPTFDGTRELTVTREIFDSGHAVVVIPFDPATGEICLIEQLRMAPLIAGENPWLLEAIAGRIDDGTNAEAIARKEAEEEAGCTVSDLFPLGRYYQSPGIFAEQITYFIARADLSQVGGIHGLDAEHEDIRAIRLLAEEAFQIISEGKISSAPTVLALLALKNCLPDLTRLWQR